MNDRNFASGFDVIGEIDYHSHEALSMLVIWDFSIWPFDSLVDYKLVSGYMVLVDCPLLPLQQVLDFDFPNPVERICFVHVQQR